MSSTPGTEALRRVAVVTAGLCAVSLAALPAENAAEPMDHATMDHSSHDMGMERDAEGRTLYGMKHKMEPALNRELREHVALYKDYSDAQIALSMDQMGQEYAWYISPPDVRGSQGVVILMHGFRERGDSMFREQMQPIADIFPTSMGVGMAMMMSEHIQIALDDVEAAGAKEVVVIPITSSATNELHRQWMYIFGQQDKPEFSSVPRVKTDMKLHFVPPPGDNPLIAEILLDRASELSKDPANEFVIIAGHGPSSAEDNAEELKALESLARIVKQDGNFADVRGMTLQDDAPREMRRANVKLMRDAVEAAMKKGQRVLIVTNLISGRSIQAKLRNDLKGLDFEFNAKGIAAHDNFTKWMGEGIRKALESS
jgi:sirohydrochlorin ferrochelatase